MTQSPKVLKQSFRHCLLIIHSYKKNKNKNKNTTKQKTTRKLTDVICIQLYLPSIWFRHSILNYTIFCFKIWIKYFLWLIGYYDLSNWKLISGLLNFPILWYKLIKHVNICANYPLPPSRNCNKWDDCIKIFWIFMYSVTYFLLNNIIIGRNY